jgi:hypothetical protein
VTEAAIGLIGVVVGGVLTGGVAYVLERRRETREAGIARRVMRAQFGQALKAVDRRAEGEELAAGLEGQAVVGLVGRASASARREDER